MCVLTKKKDRKHTEQNFHSVAGVMPQGWDLAVLGGLKKTVIYGFNVQVSYFVHFSHLTPLKECAGKLLTKQAQIAFHF